MSPDLRLRRHLYEQLTRAPRGRLRRMLRRQIRLLETTAPPGGDADGGAAGVREPRRPRPSAGPAARALDL